MALDPAYCMWQQTGKQFGNMYQEISQYASTFYKHVFVKLLIYKE